MTYTIPSQVNDASAIFVDTITLRESLGVVSNARNCSCNVKPAYNGNGSKFKLFLGKLYIYVLI